MERATGWDEADIPFFAKGEGVQDLFGWGRLGTGFSLIAGPIALQVPADKADEAYALLKDLDDA